MGRRVASHWPVSGLNSFASACGFLVLRAFQPAWLRFPGTDGWFGLTLTLGLLLASTAFGTRLAWSELVQRAQTAPSWQRILAYSAGSGAAAGVLFCALVLAVFYAPRYGVSSVPGLLSFAPFALALGAGFGTALGLLDIMVAHLLDARPDRPVAGGPQ